MSKKIIQLSTKQCAPCQVYRQEIEKIIDKTPYTYEYISLYNGPEKTSDEFTTLKYWEEVESNIQKYRKELKVNFFSFPTFILENENGRQIIDKRNIIKFLEDESK